MEGWIKLHRQIIDWEWYKDSNVKSVFLHLLLLANHETRRWQGIVIERGQLITSSTHLAEALGLTRQQVRTALDKLKSTTNITTLSTRKSLLVTIVNYEMYQSNEKEITTSSTTSLTRKQPDDNHKQELKNINLTYFINIYREQKPNTFMERMKFLRNIQNDENYANLTPDEESELRIYVMGRRE